MNNNRKNILINILGIMGILVAIFGLMGIIAKEFIMGLILIVTGVSFIIPLLKLNQVHKANEQLKEIERQKNQINIEITQLKENKENEIKSKENEIKKLIDIINSYDEELTVKYVDTRDYSSITSEQIKNELTMLGLKSKDLIKEDKATTHNIVGKKSKINNTIRQILKNFNTDVDLALSKLTYSNIDSTRGKIIKSFEATNKVFTQDEIEIAKEYLDIRLEELNLLYQFYKKVEEEKEQQKAIKEQMIEEEKVRREIEREKRKIEKEETQFKNEQNKLLQYLNKTNNDIERKLYLDKINELEEKLKQLEVDKNNVFERETNTRAGFVYIISNIGSFGENVYKIGMTRRLDPMDRVRELGSASVPFEFDVHAMIFSDDAPALEATLHNYFRNKEVNKVNQRKEFFRVSLEEIEQVVKERYNPTVEFTMIAKAEQYRESLRLQEIN